MRSWILRRGAEWLERQGLGQVAGVLEARAAELGDGAALNAVARRCLQDGDAGAAIVAAKRAVAAVPGSARYWCTLGAAHRHAGEFEAARSAYEHALSLEPTYPQVMNNLGEWYLARGDAHTALDWLNRTLAVAPGFFEARVNKVAALFELGQVEEAKAEAEGLVESHPDRPEPYVNLGNILVHTGKAKQAVRHYQTALYLRPGYPEAHYNLATLVGSREDLPKAIGYLERLIKERGESIHLLGLLAAAHQAAGDLSEAEALCRRILERQPNNICALVTLASCVSTAGDAAAALPIYEKVVALDGTQAAMGSNVLFEMTYLPDYSREEVFRHHLNWAERYEAPVSGVEPCVSRSRDRERKLKIGYLSGDFCGHPVGFLLRDILKHHDRDGFEIHCFSMLLRPDEISLELRQACDSWEDVFLLGDEALCQLIKDAEIDILVDLSGHTAFHRLLALARHPAPVQATWIGYFHSTGMSSIDYFITDPHTTPPGSGQLFSEIPVCLPHTRFCYGPPAYAPEVATRPAEGPVIFGSFNRLAKITEPVVRAWSEILKAVPDSRLVLKAGALKDPVVRDRLEARFKAVGIGPERLELRPGSPHALVLEEYGDIDLALDTFPFNGGMTTLEALWMGVPVLTLEGDTVVSRQTYAALANLGLAEELACPSVDAYVARAVALAGRRDCLARLRKEIRPRMATSPLRQAEQFTRDLEALYRRMWQAWCEGGKLPADA